MRPKDQRSRLLGTKMRKNRFSRNFKSTASIYVKLRQNDQRTTLHIILECTSPAKMLLFLIICISVIIREDGRMSHRPPGRASTIYIFIISKKTTSRRVR